MKYEKHGNENRRMINRSESTGARKVDNQDQIIRSGATVRHNGAGEWQELLGVVEQASYESFVQCGWPRGLRR